MDNNVRRQNQGDTIVHVMLHTQENIVTKVGKDKSFTKLCHKKHYLISNIFILPRFLSKFGHFGKLVNIHGLGWMVKIAVL